MNKLTRSILLSAVVLSFLTACDDPPSDSAIGVAAYVAGQPVYIDEVRYYLESNLVVDESTDELQPGTLDVWRATHRYGLPFIKVGRYVRYRTSDLDDFLDRRTVRPVVESHREAER